MATVEISNSLNDQLARIGGEMLDVQEVIERLVANWNTGLPGSHNPDSATKDQPIIREETRERFSTGPSSRLPRERGVTVDLDGTRFVGSSVKDLYEQVLRLLVDEGVISRHSTLVPFKTSNERYLISTSPNHPNGNDFFIPISYGGFYMETHKSYQTALKQLRTLLAKMGIVMRYIGL